jgi:hypothetical protein
LGGGAPLAALLIVRAIFLSAREAKDDGFACFAEELEAAHG